MAGLWSSIEGLFRRAEEMWHRHVMVDGEPNSEISSLIESYREKAREILRSNLPPEEKYRKMIELERECRERVRELLHKLHKLPTPPPEATPRMITTSPEAGSVIVSETTSRERHLENPSQEGISRLAHELESLIGNLRMLPREKVFKIIDRNVWKTDTVPWIRSPRNATLVHSYAGYAPPPKSFIEHILKSNEEYFNNILKRLRDSNLRRELESINREMRELLSKLGEEKYIKPDLLFKTVNLYNKLNSLANRVMSDILRGNADIGVGVLFMRYKHNIEKLLNEIKKNRVVMEEEYFRPIGETAKKEKKHAKEGIVHRESESTTSGSVPPWVRTIESIIQALRSNVGISISPSLIVNDPTIPRKYKPYIVTLIDAYNSGMITRQQLIEGLERLVEKYKNRSVTV